MKIHQWRKSFETGHAGLDDQHRGLITCLKNTEAYISEGNNEKAFAECQKFRVMVADHLSFEEDILGDAGFSRLDNHRKAHVDTAGKIEEVFSSCAEICKESRKASCTEEMLIILMDHLLRHDLDYKSFLQSKNLANGNA